MKQHKRLPLALLLVFALCIQILSFTSAAAALADPEPVFSASDMTFSSGTDAVALPQSAVTQLSGLSSGTIIVDFTPTAMSTANCLFSLSNSSVTDAYFNLYIDNRGLPGPGGQESWGDPLCESPGSGRSHAQYPAYHGAQCGPTGRLQVLF